MVRMFMIICSLCFSYISFAWSPQGNKIKTRWAEQVTVENVWQTDLPTPAMVASELEEPQWFVEISSDGNESEKERCALR